MAEKHIHLGKGHMRCPCCGPPPGDFTRGRMVRAKRRNARNEAIEEGLEEWSQDMDEFKDALGRPLQVGDYFVQAERTGSNSPHLTFGRVAGVYADHFTAWTVYRVYQAGMHVGWERANSRLGKRTNSYNLLILDNSLLTTFTYSGIVEALNAD